MRYGFWVLLLLAGCAGNPAQPPQIQRISAEELEQLLPQAKPNLTLEDIVAMSKQGVAPEVIIEKIRETGSSYDLTPSQGLDLARQGVNPKVLDHIHAARDQALRDGMADEVNARELKHQQEVEALKRQLLMQPWGYGPYWGYDPFWGPFPPYWRYPRYWH